MVYGKKKVLFEKKKTKLWSSWHFWKIKEIMKHVLKIQQISLMPKYIK